MSGRTDPARPVLLRQLNDQRAVDELLSRGALSRTQLAIATGLSKPTISEVITRLEAAGLVQLVGQDSGRPGPNSSLYDVPTSRWLGAAYSLRVGRVTGELVSVRGERLSELDLSLRRLPRDPGELVAALNSRLLLEAGAAPDRPIGAVAVGVPGAYDPDADRIAHLDGLPAWKAPGIAAEIQRGVGGAAAVSIENDANLALLAVSRPESAGPGVTCLLWMAEGVGLAISVAGHLFTGSAGRAGEIGYVPVIGLSSPIDASAHPMSLQDLISGGAAAGLAARHGVPGHTGTDAMAYAVTHADEPASERFLAELAERVALAVSVALAVLAPSEVILGGSLGSAGGVELARRTERALRTLTPLRTRVTHTPAGDDPVLAGAARRSTALLRQSVLAEVRIP